jgi:hypothetical protein
MKYDVVQQSLEEYWQGVWTGITAMQFDNNGFNSDLYVEFLRSNVVFGEGYSRTVTKGCYRQTGLWLLTVFTKPAAGSSRKLALANQAAELVTSKVISPIAPLSAPTVTLKVPSLFNDSKEVAGWVQAQVSVPFYYDFVGA